MDDNAIRLDLRGLKCPMPALLLERALKLADAGTIVEAIATDPMAEVDLPFAAERVGAQVLSAFATDGLVTVRVQKNKAAEPGKPAA